MGATTIVLEGVPALPHNGTGCHDRLPEFEASCSTNRRGGLCPRRPVRAQQESRRYVDYLGNVRLNWDAIARLDDVTWSTACTGGAVDVASKQALLEAGSLATAEQACS